MEELKINLDEIRDKELFSTCINLYLVKTNARKATLIESMNFKAENRKKDLDFVFSLVLKYNLLAIVENYEFGRYLVTNINSMVEYLKELEINNPDVALGNILEFYCSDHDYGNMEKERITVNINGNFPTHGITNLMTFVCEKEKINIEELKKHADKIVKKFRSVLKQEIFYQINEQSSYGERVRMLQVWNIDYINKNIESYLDDIFNEWCPNSTLEKIFVEHIKKGDNSLQKFYYELWNSNFLKIGDKLMGKGYNGEAVNNIIYNLDKDFFRKKSKDVNINELKKFIHKLMYCLGRPQS